MHDGYAAAAAGILDVRSTFVPALADVVQLLKAN